MTESIMVCPARIELTLPCYEQGVLTVIRRTHLAGAKRIELLTRVLETLVFPLN